MLRPRRPPFAGLALGLVFFSLSLTPSLVPRGWLLQGLVTGVSATIGYGLGTLASAVVRRVVPREPPMRAKRLAWRVLLLGGALLAVASVVLAGRWQQQLHLAMGAQDPTQPAYLAVLVVAAVVALLLVRLGRGLRWLLRATGGRLERVMPGWLAGVAGAVLVGVAAVVVVQEVVGRALLTAADRSFQTINETVTEDQPPPTSTLRSGGPGSVVAWEDLGDQGRKFIARATEVEELSALLRERGAATEPAEPIRVYTGLDSAEEAGERAALAVEELERTGAFDRSVLAVAMSTGTGWVNPVAAAAVEHLGAGDTAIVSMQYSYLPSWLSFLVDRERAAEAGAALFDAVHERWSRLPEDQRPRLVVYGESLGSYAAEAAFEDVEALRHRTDGAVLVGPPDSNPLRRQLVDERDEGSYERLPVVEGGRTVRFAARPADLADPDGGWAHPRVVYLQHASDPVVWWSPGLALREPDWLREPPGEGVLDAMRWTPFVTFWQLAADLAYADEVPAGHGHDYGTQVADAWVAVLDPAGWDDVDIAVLHRTLEGHTEEWERAAPD